MVWPIETFDSSRRCSRAASYSTSTARPRSVSLLMQRRVRVRAAEPCPQKQRSRLVRPCLAQLQQRERRKLHRPTLAGTMRLGWTLPVSYARSSRSALALRLSQG
eukprot:266067-Prymnesium_polylepis.1